MNVIDYIKDKKILIGFYIMLMVFISLVVYLDPVTRIHIENLIYINAASLIFFIIYLASGYLFRRVYYRGLSEVINNKNEDAVNFLPRPQTNEQALYHELIKNIYEGEREKLSKLYEEKKNNQEFITSFVHEVKTPISVIRLIIENSSNKPVEEVLNSIEDEVDRIENQVEQALYYSRIDSFSRDYFINEISLNKLSSEGVKRNAKAFINKKIKLDIACEEHVVLTDKKWILFIIDQILSNSLKYTGEGGTIKISSEKDSIETRLIIEDSGIGIKGEDLLRVFDRGFTGQTGRQHIKSTGMGLYLAKELAVKLGQNITISSEYGKYTRVTIHFPKHNTYYDVTKM